MTTFCFHSSSTDPYFHLAAEEYFLKNFQQDFFILWRSETSVVVGKHQNALAEINHEFVRQHQIPVARRLSGGGTVFHDLGNLNFTFIRSVEKISEVNFKLFTQPIVEALKSFKINAYTTGRNDLQIDGLKISGNAEHVHKNRVLHHGTLLFDSQLETLSGALKVDLSKYSDKSVQSNRSEVTNIAKSLSVPMHIDDFANQFFAEITSKMTGSQLFEPTLSDLQAIGQLANEKYRTWDWIYGYSPRYRFSNTIETAKGIVSIQLLVEKGLLSEVSISGAIDTQLSIRINELLAGCRHDFYSIQSLLLKVYSELLASNIYPEILLAAMF
jgi:lipoate-protein ligase A